METGRRVDNHLTSNQLLVPIHPLSFHASWLDTQRFVSSFLCFLPTLPFPTRTEFEVDSRSNWKIKTNDKAKCLFAISVRRVVVVRDMFLLDGVRCIIETHSSTCGS